MIFCIGIAVVDLVFELDRPLFENQKNQANDFNILIGGNGANVSKVLSYYGHVVTLLSPFGSDYLGELIKKDLEKTGVSLVELDTNIQQTPISVVLNNRYQASRTIINYKENYPDANFKLNIKPDWFYSDGRFPNHTKEARNIFKSTPLLWDWERADHYINNQLSINAGDVLICSEDFVFDMLHRIDHGKRYSDEQSLVDFLYTSTLLETIIITKGALGLAYSNVSQSKLEYFDAPAVKAIDTNGAGDVFHAIFLHYVIAGFSHRDAMLRAMDIAGIFVSKTGFIEALPIL